MQKLREEQELHRREKGVQHEQEHQEVHHRQIDETTPIKVIDSSEQLAQSIHGEQSQEQDFAQEIEQSLKQMDTDMEQQELEKDIYLMPHHQEVDPQISLDPKVEHLLRYQ